MEKVIEKIEDLRETLQEDLLTFFDGMPNKTMNEMCDIIVKNCNNTIVKIKVEEKRSKN